MENTNTISIPILEKKIGRKQKTDKITVEKKLLARINRETNCIYCGAVRILNPDQYQALFDLYESEEKIKEEFFCKPCEMQMRKNPFKFWTIYGDNYKNLLKNLKTTFDIYKTSSRSLQDASALQTMTVSFLKECYILEPNFEFITMDKVPVGMIVKNVPFVGNVHLQVYESKSDRIIVK